LPFPQESLAAVKIEVSASRDPHNNLLQTSSRAMVPRSYASAQDISDINSKQRTPRGGLAPFCSVLRPLPQILLDCPKKADVKRNGTRNDGGQGQLHGDAQVATIPFDQRHRKKRIKSS
jgi:hypothetical protein